MDFMTSFNEKKAKLLEENKDLTLDFNLELKAGYSFGDVLRKITGIEKINLEGNKQPVDAEYEHPKREVVLMYFWV